MSKFDERVRELVAQELADVRNLFLDADMNPETRVINNPSSPGFGEEGLKPEIARIEQLLSLLYASEIAKSTDDQSEEGKEVRKLVEQLITEDTRDPDNSPAADKIFKWLEEYHPDININLPFSGDNQLDTNDIIINQGIRALPIPKKWRALGMLLFGAGKKLVGALDKEQLKWMIWDLMKWSDNTKKEVETLLLKMENEVKDDRAAVSRLQQSVDRLPIPTVGNNNSLAAISMLQALQAEVSEIRGLL